MFEICTDFNRNSLYFYLLLYYNLVNTDTNGQSISVPYRE